MLKNSRLLISFSFFVIAISFVLVAIRPVFAVTFQLSGVVTDSSGTGIDGAVVNVIDPNTNTNVGSGVSNGSGSYNIVINEGVYNIQVDPPANSTFGSALVLNRTISSSTIINFVLVSVGSVSLSGHIYGPLGNGLPNQTISLTGDTNYSATTDASGVYSINFLPGNYQIQILGNSTNFTNIPSSTPQTYGLFINGQISFNQSTVLDFTVPAKQVTVHVQDALNNSITNASVQAQINAFGSTHLEVGNGMIASGTSNEGGTGFSVVTDSSGDALLWLLPNDANKPYTFSVVPPSGSIYTLFTLSNVIILGDQTEVVSLQFIHPSPVTTINLSPAPDAQGFYPNPVTVTLSATAASGFTIAQTYYKIDGGMQQNYSAPFTVSGFSTHTVTYWSVDSAGVPEGQKNSTFTINVKQLNALNSAKIWVGLKNSDDVGVKFDLRAEVYKDTTLVTSGQINSVAAGSSGFGNAKLNTIPFNSFAPIDFPSGSVLKIKLLVRNARTGSGHNSGTARLWFNDSAANSQFGATIGSNSNTYFLGTGFNLLTSVGSGPKATVDVVAGAKCSPFKTFGTWTITL